MKDNLNQILYVYIQEGGEEGVSQCSLASWPLHIFWLNLEIICYSLIATSYSKCLEMFLLNTTQHIEKISTPFSNYSNC